MADPKKSYLRTIYDDLNVTEPYDTFRSKIKSNADYREAFYTAHSGRLPEKSVFMSYFDSHPPVTKQADSGADFSNYNTALPKGKEADYNKWLKDNNITDVDANGDGYNYDYKGAFAAGESKSENGHFTDKFKKPNHSTFSVESKYNGVDGKQGGTWEGEFFVSPAIKDKLKKPTPEKSEEAKNAFVKQYADARVAEDNASRWKVEQKTLPQDASFRLATDEEAAQVANNNNQPQTKPTVLSFGDKGTIVAPVRTWNETQADRQAAEQQQRDKFKYEQEAAAPNGVYDVLRKEETYGIDIADITPSEYGSINKHYIGETKSEPSTELGTYRQDERNYRDYETALNTKINLQKAILDRSGKLQQYEGAIAKINELTNIDPSTLTPETEKGLKDQLAPYVEQLKQLEADPDIIYWNKLTSKAAKTMDEKQRLKEKFSTEFQTRMADLQKGYQEQRENVAKEGGLANVLMSITDPFRRATTSFALGAIDLPISIKTALFNTDPTTDAIREWVENTDYELKNYNQRAPSSKEGNLIQQYVEHNGYRILVDNNGNPYDVRMSDSWFRPESGVVDDVISSYSKLEEKPPVKTAFNGAAGFNNVSNVIGDLAMLSAGSRSGITGFGLTNNSAKKAFTGLMIATQMHHNLEDALQDAGLTQQQIDQYTLGQSAIVSMINMYHGNFENQLAGIGKEGVRQSIQRVVTENEAKLLSGQLSTSQLTKMIIRDMASTAGKNMSEEFTEEMILEKAGNFVGDQVFNKMYGTQVNSLPQSPIDFMNEAAYVVLSTGPVSVLTTPTTKRSLFDGAVWTGVSNPEGFAATINAMTDAGKVDKEQGQKMITAMNNISADLKSMDIPEEQKFDLASVMYRNQMFKDAKESANSPAVAKAYEEKEKETEQAITSALTTGEVSYFEENEEPVKTEDTNGATTVHPLAKKKKKVSRKKEKGLEQLAQVTEPVKEEVEAEKSDDYASLREDFKKHENQYGDAEISMITPAEYLQARELGFADKGLGVDEMRVALEANEIGVPISDMEEYYNNEAKKVETEAKEKFGRKDGKGLVQPKNNNERWQYDKLKTAYNTAILKAKAAKSLADITQEESDGALDTAVEDFVNNNPVTDKNGNLDLNKVKISDLKEAGLLNDEEAIELKQAIKDEQGGETTKDVVTQSEAGGNEDQEQSTGKRGKKGNPKGKDRIANGLDELGSALGTKAEAVGDEKPDILRALTNIGLGLVEEGIATAENLIEKIKEAIIAKFPSFDITQVDAYEQQLLDAMPGMKKKALEKRILKAVQQSPEMQEFQEQLTGLTYEPESQDKARAMADTIIEQAGDLTDEDNFNNFLDLVNGQLKGAVKSFAYGNLIDTLAERLKGAEGDEKERITEQMNVLVDNLSENIRAAGREISAMQNIYLNSPEGIYAFEKRKAQREREAKINPKGVPETSRPKTKIRQADKALKKDRKEAAKEAAGKVKGEKAERTRAERKLDAAKRQVKQVQEKYKGKKLITSTGTLNALLPSVRITEDGINYAKDISKAYFNVGLAGFEVLVEKVKEQFKIDTGVELNDEELDLIRNEIRPDWEKRVEKATKGEMKEQGLNIQQILEQSTDIKADTREGFANELKTRLENEGYESVDDIVETFVNEYDRLLTERANKSLDGIFKPNLKESTIGRKKRKGEHDKIVEAIKWGVLDNDVFADLFAAKFGFANMSDPDVINDLKNYADLISQFPADSIERNFWNNELMAYKAYITGEATWGNILLNNYYANILSSPNTIFRAINANISNNGLAFVTKMIRNTLEGRTASLGTLKDAFYANKGFGVADLNVGTLEAINAWKSQSTGDNMGTSIAEMYAKFGKSKFSRTWGKFASTPQRLLSAFDLLFSSGGKEGQLADLIVERLTAENNKQSKENRVTGDEINEMARNILGYNPDIVQDAMEQAEAEYKKVYGEELDKAQTLRMKRRALQIIKDGMADRLENEKTGRDWLDIVNPDDLHNYLEQSEQFGNKIGMMGTPEGTMGVLAATLATPGRLMPFSKYFIATFVNAPLNGASTIITGNPLVGGIRTIKQVLGNQRGLGLLREFAKREGIRTDYYGALDDNNKQFNMEKKELLIKYLMVQSIIAGGVSAIALGLKKAGAGDDDDPIERRKKMFEEGKWKEMPFFVTGNFFGASNYEVNQAFSNSYGIKPNTLYMYGKEVVNYQNNPVTASWLATMGVYSDMELFRPDGAPSKADIGIVLESTWKQLNAVKQQSSLQSLSKIMDFISGTQEYSTGTLEEKTDKFAKAQIETAKSIFLPTGLLRYVDNQADAALDNELKNPIAWYDYIAKDVPLVSDVVINDSRNDHFGDPIITKRSAESPFLGVNIIAASQDIQEQNRELYELFFDKGSSTYKFSTNKKYVTLDEDGNPVSKVMTKGQLDEINEYVGKGLKDQLVNGEVDGEKLIDLLRKLPLGSFDYYVNKIQAKYMKEAQELYLQVPIVKVEKKELEPDAKEEVTYAKTKVKKYVNQLVSE